MRKMGEREGKSLVGKGGCEWVERKSGEREKGERERGGEREKILGNQNK